MQSEPLEESYERRLDLKVWRELWRYTKPYRREVTVLVLAGVFVALMDISFPLVAWRVVDSVAEHGADAPLARYAVLHFLLTLGLAGGVYLFIWMGGKVRTHLAHDIRRDGFENLQRLSFSYFDKRPVGWLMSRMTSDCERLSNIFAWGTLDIFWGVTAMTGVAAVMLIMNAKVALLVLTIVPFLAWISLGFQKRILASSRVVRKTNSKLTAGYNESIMGVRTTKVFGREERNLSDFDSVAGTMEAASVRNALQSALYLPLVTTLASLATGLALAVGGVDVIAGGMTVGMLVAFMGYTFQFFEPVQELAARFAEMQMAQASAERILGLVEAEPEVQDSAEVRELVARHAAVSPSLPSGEARLADDGLPDRIETIGFHGVSFAYGDGPPVLEDFDLEVEAGDTIALVGSTGGGKSTIVSLLCRFYEPTQGEIRIDGLDYRRRSLLWLQSNLGIVLQEPHLFSGTIADNIRYGRLDATDAEVEEVARVTGAHEFVSEMEQSYATEVGEGGVLLSTGQKQLISFARALLARPKILVMDEATSSVDTETERHIQAALTRVLEAQTSFVIAHRLSTIRNADRILVIEGGHIVEQGTHGELLSRQGRYHELYTRQSLRESGRSDSAWSGPGDVLPAPAT